VLATPADAEVLGLNAVCDGLNVVLPAQADRLAEDLRARGYRVIGVDLSELRKAGGGPKCCTLEVRA
jgi:N-dimethylarginine dimethylaminohydrolase